MHAVEEIVQFHKNGSLAMWLRTDPDGRKIAQAYSPVGQLVLEEITTTDGILTRQANFPDGKPQEWTRAKVGKGSTFTDRDPSYVHKEWSRSQVIVLGKLKTPTVTIQPITPWPKSQLVRHYQEVQHAMVSGARYAVRGWACDGCSFADRCRKEG